MLALTPPTSSYKPRRAHETPLYRIVLDHHEKFVGNYDELYAAQYGVWRPHVAETLERYLECGILANGFLRVKCTRCKHEILVPWSCKKAGLCPSCGQRRALEFGEFVHQEVLEDVPYRHVVFTLPKMLRPTFLRDRRLLRRLGRCAWLCVRRGLRTALGNPKALPGAIIAVATAGDLANPHPHVHAIFSHGAWKGRELDANFFSWPTHLTSQRLEELFRRLVLSMLLRAERISEATVSKLLTWNPTGFSAWLGDPIYPNPDEHAWRKRLARYLIKNPVSLERLAYDDSTCIVTYTSHQRGQSKTFTALDFIAELSVHIPDRKRHCAVYLGRCSNRLRGERRKAAGQALPMLNTIPQPSRATIIDSDNPWDVESPKLQRSRKAFRIAWATLLKQVWNVDVNICKQCCAPAKIIAAVTQLRVVERILTHLGLFERPRAPTNHHCPNTLTQRQHPHQAFCFQEVDAPQQFDERDTHLDTLWVADPPFAED